MLAVASKILKDYGSLLGTIEPGCCALPRSFLPHSKAAIREASLRVLETLEPKDEALRDALIRGFVFLSQFVDDEEAERVAEGQAQLDTLALQGGVEGHPPSALAALRVINRIKLEMEKSLLEACIVARIPLEAAPKVLEEKENS